MKTVVRERCGQDFLRGKDFLHCADCGQLLLMGERRLLYCRTCKLSESVEPLKYVLCCEECRLPLLVTPTRSTFCAKCEFHPSLQDTFLWLIEEAFPCLGILTAHSWEPWYWIPEKNCYRRECSIAGCSASEIAQYVLPAGPRFQLPIDSSHEHEFDEWVSTAGPSGTYLPPWKYKRKCKICDKDEKAEEVVKGG